MMKRNDWHLVWLLLLVTVERTLATRESSSIDRGISRVNDTAKPARVSKRGDYDADLYVETFLGDLFGHEKHLRDNNVVEERTFGHKRVQFMLMPMIYKMGVMMTMLTVLIAISLKGLMIGVVLLVLKLSSIFAKFYAGWQPQGHVHGHDWSASPPQPVHVHVHNEPLHHAHHQAYSGWSSASAPVEDEHYYYKG